MEGPWKDEGRQNGDDGRTMEVGVLWNTSDAKTDTG